MLDLNTIFGMREQMLPQEGFLGFLLQNWLTIAIVVMILGFLIDQVLYVVRYRPQDKFLQMYRWIRNQFLRVTGKEPVAESEKAAEEDNIHAKSAQEMPDRPAVRPSAEDAPIIRRGGAKYAPASQMPVPEQISQKSAAFGDDDAPLVVRASSGPQRRNMGEPDTHRREIR